MALKVRTGINLDQCREPTVPAPIVIFFDDAAAPEGKRPYTQRESLPMVDQDINAASEPFNGRARGAKRSSTTTPRAVFVDTGVTARVPATDTSETAAPSTQPPWLSRGRSATIIVSIDRAFQANLARLTSGHSPAALA
jgi:Poly-beta-hydroxybutyrate polymerase N terminal